MSQMRLGTLGISIPHRFSETSSHWYALNFGSGAVWLVVMPMLLMECGYDEMNKYVTAAADGLSDVQCGTTGLL